MIFEQKMALSSDLSGCNSIETTQNAISKVWAARQEDLIATNQKFCGGFQSPHGHLHSRKSLATTASTPKNFLKKRKLVCHEPCLDVFLKVKTTTPLCFSDVEQTCSLPTVPMRMTVLTNPSRCWQPVC